MLEPTKNESFLRRKEAFLSRAQGYRAVVEDFWGEEADLNELKARMVATGIVIVGEIHGTVQNADTIYVLCKKLGIRRVALEYPSNLQTMVDLWLLEGLIDFDVIESFPDGRITAEQFAVLKQLKEEGLLDEVICIDAADDSSEIERDRDEAMTTNLMNKRDGAKAILAVAGNYHTDVVIHEDAQNGTHEPLGYRVKQQVPNVPIIILHYRSGQYHSYGLHDFASQDLLVNNVPYLTKVDQQYHIVIPEATPAMVPDPDRR